MEGRIEKLSANIDTLTRVLQERLVMQFPYVGTVNSFAQISSDILAEV